MIDTIRQWLLAIITAAICLAVLDAMTAKGAAKRIGKAAGGLVMFLVLLQPLHRLDLTALEGKYADYQVQLDEEIGDYTQLYRQQLALVIEEDTAAYISEKAASFGLACRAEVTTQIQDGVPVPHSVRMSVPRNETLAQWMERELGIPQDRQYWEVDGDESHQSGIAEADLEEIPAGAADPAGGTDADAAARRK